MVGSPVSVAQSAQHLILFISHTAPTTALVRTAPLGQSTDRRWNNVRRHFDSLAQLDYFNNISFVNLGANYYVQVLSTLDRELLINGCNVALHKYSNALVDILPPEADSSIQMLLPDEKPGVSYTDIGGLDTQKQEVREAVELPLTHGQLYKQVWAH